MKDGDKNETVYWFILIGKVDRSKRDSRIPCDVNGTKSSGYKVHLR